MSKIVIEINSCDQCPLFHSSPYPTADSFERPEYWWCKADDMPSKSTEDEQHRLSIKNYLRLDKLRKIAGYVEWHDKTPIPEWCPNKIVHGKKEEICAN